MHQDQHDTNETHKGKLSSFGKCKFKCWSLLLALSKQKAEQKTNQNKLQWPRPSQPTLHPTPPLSRGNKFWPRGQGWQLCWCRQGRQRVPTLITFAPPRAVTMGSSVSNYFSACQHLQGPCHYYESHKSETSKKNRKREVGHTCRTRQSKMHNTWITQELLRHKLNTFMFGMLRGLCLLPPGWPRAAAFCQLSCQQLGVVELCRNLHKQKASSARRKKSKKWNFLLIWFFKPVHHGVRQAVMPLKRERQTTESLI